MMVRLILSVAAMVLMAAPGASAGAAPEAVAFDHARLSRLMTGERTLLEDLTLEGNIRVSLDLERFEILAPDARVVLGTADGDRPMAPSNLVLLKGAIVGEDDSSTAFVSVGRWGVNGFVSRDGFLYSISTGPYAGVVGAGLAAAVTPASALPVAGGVACGYSPGDARYNPPYANDPDAPPAPVAAPRGGSCELAVLAVDTDWEFTANLFGGNPDAAADYAMTLHGAVSAIYLRDTGVKQAIGYLRVWEDDVDPYGGGDMGTFLDQLRNHWNAQMGGVGRVVTHGLSGRPLGGGVAYVNVLCNTGYGYGVSTSLGGSFPFPTVDHNHGNWDPFVVAHELGHNFGTGHTHDSYNPPIDGCGNGDCSAAWGGTIMSYCHGCAGGMSNIVLGFHPRVQTVIEATVAGAGCISTVDGGVSAVDDRAEAISGIPVTVHALDNDAAVSCVVPVVASVESPTPGGGTVTINTAGDLDRLRYTSAPGFSGEDAFEYTLIGGATATVTVGVHTLRAPDAPADPQPGVRVDYYALASPVTLPDFDGLTPITGGVVSHIDFPAAAGLFATGPFANNVGAVFEGFVEAPIPGLYTFEIESDDGSRMLVGGAEIVDNDGLHGMTAERAVVGLLPGLHRVRVEFFEAGGDAGLIVRNALSTDDPAVIPPSRWFWADEVPCPADSNGDGTLDFFDVQAFLNDYAAGDPAADFNGDGAIDFFDVQGYLNAFAAGCP